MKQRSTNFQDLNEMAKEQFDTGAVSLDDLGLGGMDELIKQAFP